MKAVLQRVNSASLSSNEESVSEIGKGVLAYVGILKGDNEYDLEFIARKISSLRLFSDDNGRLNISPVDVKGEILLVSNFTIGANCRKGNRPSFDSAAEQAEAKRLFELLVEMLKDSGLKVKTGVFGAHMKIDSQADGPVNIFLDSRT
ncbi:D-aminoacyl-tRNA deacylase [Sedimentisphaera salicampi]|uniref:D-aminoacyl-tRNA deacylase n=1 Tax=Sedimentisphaera salicampi TaxID=1941349 RepID=A0A1W6LQG0_9BACT|nr:D-aminoacyl-tRNA deacylase [Sedimentisphaera salicampi]ARN58007.1 D-tyrosyl-tRNA(Tyr) deacylase [Sedimentisphaera salicampi]OXU14172.1 D-tyrosyl-tRNA(Tyr) deacylase [Sedimentisphaera salicampi]